MPALQGEGGQKTTRMTCQSVDVQRDARHICQPAKLLWDCLQLITIQGPARETLPAQSYTYSAAPPYRSKIIVRQVDISVSTGHALCQEPVMQS